ncbi:MAG: anthranilate phosphoribosyltransferase [bacterium]|nr:anthranilate phosphoribosyltransferase [bacterium]
MDGTTRDATTVATAVGEVVLRRDLSESRAYDVASAIMEGLATPAQIAALLIGLRMKGETVEEIAGFVRAMRDKVDRVPVAAESVVDTCGTGGDGLGTFNISTVVAFVAAGAGCRVAKHGNRSVSSKCGSSEVLEALGVEPEVGPEEAARSIEEIGISFLFAPRYHQATRHAVGPRREIGVRSIFNIIGPLTNPALAERQLMGIFKPELTEPACRVLQRLGSTHCMVVHGSDGLDELTLSGPTRVSELRDGAVASYDLDPRELGFELRATSDYRGGDPATNARIALEILEGREGAPRDIVLLNAGAVCYVSGLAPDVAGGVELAREALDSGAALAKLEALRERTRSAT